MKRWNFQAPFKLSLHVICEDSRTKNFCNFFTKVEQSIRICKNFLIFVITHVNIFYPLSLNNNVCRITTFQQNFMSRLWFPTHEHYLIRWFSPSTKWDQCMTLQQWWHEWCNVTNFNLSRDSKILFTETIKNFHFFDNHNQIKLLLEKECCKNCLHISL